MGDLTTTLTVEYSLSSSKIFSNWLPISPVDPKIIAVFNNIYQPPSSSFSFCETDLGNFLFITFQIPLPEAII